ncbi:hypothetical protein [Halostagnicola bangensis]
MSNQDSMMAEEDEAFTREATYIMIVWTIVVVAAGVLLVLMRDPLAAIFAFSGLGL